MKSIKITEEQHDRLRTYAFFEKMTIQEVVSNSINQLLDNTTSSKVVDTTNVKVVEGTTTTNVLGDLDWTDKEAQKLIEKYLK
jgi:hypothetical protein